ncbi:MAG: Regulatory protein ArsR [Candidatus Beckwithbacteria bacterium GW2011_GWB1_47_15]|uniref:Regulatory protein ArsR n=1 Tax=Candidatus Beckwithbacteria bacterium GW2011_GWB1_47_15 TaxID=1618371 RepID=A0A0G1URX8_9BACT|nr:MAG: regulatory protein ArsR [Candidatus Beckwithbacteria bacterium GW2011_GWC1_49_16]AQS30951.1 hypothetical protein [uncultured bacterium]KKU34881.1 MAG: Regulatory protein ArsR [Candidatus Beckwithbacteria bacterium GW2011_GWA1_46_30]KKU60475.1 MAG: Regulatory protein ArsR [Candidatus Beckwithbacteria bacterium GW2011_GWB1_47_15]KKU72350.1 MAG: Regulatory protein ArsR [Candidatus Beckwithbacteria bacterium GW2011_GWA2_47_25]OGD48242.1 MAG: hypothetical protein A2877_01890 [Candidatus Bec
MYKQIFELHADTYKALAAAKRLEIVQLLRDQELTVTKIQQMLGLPQPNLSQHLQVLREHKLVNTKRNGQHVYYKLSHPNVVKSVDLVREMLVEQNRGDDKLTEELRLKMKDLVPLSIDPVCHMRVSPKTAAEATGYKGRTYYFCASGCKKTFKKSPQKYVRQ